MPSRSPYQRSFRVVAGVLIILLLAILCIALWTPTGLSDEARKILAWVAGTIVVFAVVGGNWIGFKEGFWNLKRSYRVELSDGKIIQRRSGSPVVEIPIDQISSIRQSRGEWLIVRGGEPERQVGIPSEIVGFESLKREILANHPGQPLKIDTSPWAFLPSLTLIVAAIFLFMSRSHWAVMAAGAAVLLLQGLGIFSVRRIMRSNPKPNLVAFAYILTFLVSCWIVYERATSHF
jgi:hypothetical protein